MHRLVVRTLRRVALTLGVATLAAQGASAQFVLSADPAQTWRTFSTGHFRVHYRVEQSAWARHVAERLEGIRTAVGREVGYLPPIVTDVVIDDPINTPNGSALPFMDGPVMFFWPTPPDPSSGLGHSTTWGELLSVHEFAHIAHLARPAREPLERLEQLLPIVPHLGPIPRRVPSWVTEGYATLVEGRLSASGRPNSVWRAAVLRTWALEGVLPSYDGLGDAGPFLGGSMRYLVGSAYLEWLAQARGDSVLPQFWRRLSARVPRSFEGAFTGSFGEPPSAMYGQFTSRVIERAFAVQRQRSEAGLVEGDRVARLERSAGTPALSPDGSRLAIALAPGTDPSRIEIWNTARPPVDSEAVRELARQLERDPEDVADYSPWPRRPRAVSTLWPVRGRAHGEPRFLPDGRRLLVTRMEPLASGALRPDLFIWDPRLNEVTRVTKGEGIRAADPTPDGEFAVGVRCGAGSCDVVEVALERGTVRVLAAGTPDRSFAGARVSPDGRLVATALHEGGRWRIALVARTDGAIRFIDPPDHASRFAPTWAHDGQSLVVVSEVGGVADLERLTLDGHRQPLTRVLSAANSPELSRDGRDAWFLTLHARGWDLRRLALSGAPLASVATIEGPEAVAGTPAAPNLVSPPRPATRLSAWPVGPVHDAEYGVGPRGWRLLPIGATSSIGSNAGLALTLVDPVGRFPILVQGLLGNREAWRGGAMTLAWRADRPTFELQAFYAREEPSQGAVPPKAGTTLDREQAGAAVAFSLDRVSSVGQHRYATGVLGGSVAALLRGDVQQRTGRVLGWMETAHRFLVVRGGSALLGGEFAAHVAHGNTDATTWTRVVGSALVRFGSRESQVELGGAFGRVNGGAPASEQFHVGGLLTTLLPGAALSQRFESPAFAAGALEGYQAARGRVAWVSAPVSLFYEVLAAGRQVERAADWWRVAGIDLRLPVDPIPMVRLPGLELRAGGAYAFDDLRSAGWRGWLLLSARP